MFKPGRRIGYGGLVLASASVIRVCGGLIRQIHPFSPLRQPLTAQVPPMSKSWKNLPGRNLNLDHLPFAVPWLTLVRVAKGVGMNWCRVPLVSRPGKGVYHLLKRVDVSKEVFKPSSGHWAPQATTRSLSTCPKGQCPVLYQETVEFPCRARLV